jgi:nitroreductase
MQFSKPIPELVKERFSCRTYQQVHLDQQKRNLLSDFAAAARIGPLGTKARFKLVSASEGDNAALRGLGTYGFIKGATGYIIGAIDREQDNLEDYGFLLEGIILYATGLGLGTCWLGGTFTKSSFARKIFAQKHELVPAVASVGYVATKPRWIETKLRRNVGPERRLPWERLFFEGGFGVPLKPLNLDGYQQVLEMVRWSPSASNRQPWRVIKLGENWHFYLQRTPGYRESPLVKFTTVADLQRIDMGIAMNHFDLMARELNIKGEWVVADPLIELPDEHTEYTVTWMGTT